MDRHIHTHTHTHKSTIITLSPHMRGRGKRPKVSFIGRFFAFFIWSYCISQYHPKQWPADSALMMAAREGSTEVVSLLIEAGANIQLQNVVNFSECVQECGF